MHIHIFMFIYAYMATMNGVPSVDENCLNIIKFEIFLHRTLYGMVNVLSNVGGICQRIINRTGRGLERHKVDCRCLMLTERLSQPYKSCAMQGRDEEHC